MIPTSDVLTNAFQVLASIVREAYSIGRPCMGAGLKLRLRHGSFNSFDERRLGFFKFGDFLRAAERAGFVQLRSTPGGDIAVFPPGIPIPQSPSVLSSRLTTTTPLTLPESRHSYSNPIETSGYVRVRPDLWNAFNSYSSAWVYDRLNDIAYKLPQSADAGDGSTLPANPNTIQIPAGRDRVLGWMRSFAAIQDTDTKARLLATLEDNAGPFQFRNAVSTDIGLRKGWRRYHIQQVLTAIEMWANSNQLTPKDIATRLNPLGQNYWTPRLLEPVVPTPAVEAEPRTTEPQSPSLTPHLTNLVDQLIDELLRLRGTMQVIKDKH